MKQLLAGYYYTDVDDEDYDRVKATGATLTFTRVNGRVTSIRVGAPHRCPITHFILGAPPDGMMIDHVDRNPLNNQRSNLRVVTRSTNGHNRAPNRNNRTGFKGVKVNGNGAIFAELKVNGIAQQRYGFKTFRDAAVAYDEMARETGLSITTNKELGLL